MQITETVIKVNDEIKRRMIDKVFDLCDGVGQRQDHRGAGRDLQAQYRRHARSPQPDHRARAGGRRGKGARGRPAGPARGRGAVARRAPGAKMPYAAAEGADAVVISDRMERIPRAGSCPDGPAMRTPAMADLRNIYSADEASEAGFTAYTSIGRRDFTKHG